MVLAVVAGALVAFGIIVAVVTQPLGSDPRPSELLASNAVSPSATTASTPEPSGPQQSSQPPSTTGSAGPTAAVTTGLDVGQLAPDFELSKVGGGSLRLSDLRGHPVWVNFWAPWCPACRTEIPRIEGFWLGRQADGLIVLGVGVRDTPDAFRSYAAEVGATYPLVMDLDGKVAERYRALALPVHYWLDRDGIVRDWAFGELPPDVLAASVERIMPSPGPTQ
jgi:peroxiredoxin